MPIATLQDLKGVMHVDPDDTSNDDSLQAKLDAAERYVVRVTGLSTVSEQRTQYFQRVSGLRPLQLERRPVLSLVTIEGRDSYSSTMQALTADLADAEQGVMVVDVNAGKVYPTLRVVYQTGVADIPPDLSDATATLAAYWAGRDKGGAVSSTAMGGMSESLRADAVPTWIMERLIGYIPPDRWWVP